MKIATLDENALQAWMVSRVANELGVSEAEVDTDAQLMSLGIDSMTLIGIAGELAELVAEDLPAEMMWEYPSIAALARHLDSRIQSRTAESDLTEAATLESSEAVPASRARHWSPIRVFQPNGNRTPLFFIHSVSGDLSCYYELARRLGEDQPTYGLCQLPDSPGTVEQMAEALLDGLRTVQRSGPYRLGGYCFAGVVAYEMARQLEKNGEEVELVAMFDPPAPARSPRRPGQDFWAWISSAATTIARSPAFLIRELVTEPHEFRARFTRFLGRSTQRLRHRMRLTQQSNLDQIVREMFNSNDAVYLNNIAALQDYSPQSYSGRLTLFQSSENLLFHGISAWQWLKLAGGGAVVLEIPGNHNGMMRAAGADILAQKLRTQFDKLE